MKHRIALQVLHKELSKLGGELFNEYFMRLKGNKKDIEANDFLTALITGENIKKEWKLENYSRYSDYIDIVKTINLLNI